MLRALHRVLSVRDWVIVRSNPVLENGYLAFYGQLLHPVPPDQFLVHTLLFVLLSCAMFHYGYLLNDFVDRERDTRRDPAHHPPTNIFVGTSTSYGALVVLVSLLSNLPFVIHFARGDAAVAVVYVTWLACMSGYSWPGVYLKARGVVGLVVVALALRTLPAALYFVSLEAPFDAGWGLILAYVTLRGTSADLAHQRLHLAEDSGNGLSTFAVEQGMARSTRLLGLNYRMERLALLAVTWWIAACVPTASPDAVGVVVAGLPALSVTLLVAYAERRASVLAELPDPHRFDYGRDVFYLLHKNFPKAVLPAALLAVLAWMDARASYVLLAALLGLYLRMYSWDRIARGLRIRVASGAR